MKQLTNFQEPGACKSALKDGRYVLRSTLDRTEGGRDTATSSHGILSQTIIRNKRPQLERLLVFHFLGHATRIYVLYISMEHTGYDKCWNDRPREDGPLACQYGERSGRL